MHVAGIQHHVVEAGLPALSAVVGRACSCAKRLLRVEERRLGPQIRRAEFGERHVQCRDPVGQVLLDVPLGDVVLQEVPGDDAVAGVAENVEVRRRPDVLLERERVHDRAVGTRARARDEDRVRVHEVFARPLLGDLCVHVALVVDRDALHAVRVLVVDDRVAPVHVAGAVGNEHRVPVAERILGVRRGRRSRCSRPRDCRPGPSTSCASADCTTR